MARYRRRRYYRKGKYNIENRPVQITTPTDIENGFYQNQIEIVPATSTEGVRQVSRLTVTITPTTSTPIPPPLYWALVYVPEGVGIDYLFPEGTNALFEPSNYVLSSGISDNSAGPIRVSSRLKKNLNSGDRIFLLTATIISSINYRGLVRYAIKFN